MGGTQPARMRSDRLASATRVTSKGTRESSVVEENGHLMARSERYPWVTKDVNSTIYTITLIIEPYAR